MKIAVDCYEAGKHVTGVGRVTHSILISLTDILKEHDFFILTREPISEYKRPNVKQSTIPPRRGYFRWQNGPLFRRLKEIDPDVFIAPNYTLPFFNRWKSILFEHDVSFASHPEWFSRKESLAKRLIAGRSLKMADIVMTGSEFSKEEIVKYFRISPEKIRVFSYGVEETFQRSPESQIQEWKRKKGLEGKRIVGYLGAIFNRRNIPLLVESVDLLRKEVPMSVLYVVGRDLTRPSQDIEQILDKEWIRWDAQMEEKELPLFYSSLDVFAYLSEYEGFGLPPLEALACGTIPVLLNTSSLKEIFSDMAIMVNKPHLCLVKQALMTAMTEEKKREAILRRFIEKRSIFSWSRTAQEISKLCQDMIS
ncbi:MAG: glycosyltransferase family 4 protein [Candidatus Aminicenantales bacterium]